jgi:hypothetical protein
MIQGFPLRLTVATFFCAFGSSKLAQNQSEFTINR